MQIDKDVPIPPKRSGIVDRVTKYPFRDLAVGDSFLVESDSPVLAQKQLLAAITYWKKALPGLIFTTRCVDGGVRVWRIK